jgi:alpha-tubulin suppressor-like RCC1 family protein
MSGSDSPNPRRSDPAAKWVPLSAVLVLGILVGYLWWSDRSSADPSTGPQTQRTGTEEAVTSRAVSKSGGDPVPAPPLTGLPLPPPPVEVDPAFARQGGPVLVRPFPRGENGERRHHVPVVTLLSGESLTGAARALAMSPADGRIALLPEEVDNHTRRARRMALDLSSLDAVVAGETARLLAPMPDGKALTLLIRSVKNRGGSTFTMEGEVEGEPQKSVAQLVYHDGVLHGTVARFHLEQELEYRVLADGHLMVRELEQLTMKDVCGDPGRSPESSPETPDAEGGGENGPPEAPEADTPGHTTIDIVVGYDRAAREADGGRAQIEARIISAVDRMNLSFANSLITQTELMLLGTVEDPAYVFPGDVAGDMLEELVDLEGTTGSSPELNTVSDYANALGADLRSFVIREVDGSAGIAYRPGRSSITARDYMTSTRLTFEHELGHNFGARHSWGDTSGSDGVTTVSEYGWRLEPAGQPRVRTIMAYDWSWGTGVRIPYFANPDVLYQGARTGQVNGYNATGDAQSDSRYVSGGLVGTLGAGFNGSNPNLGARNAQALMAAAAGRAALSTRTAFGVVSPALSAVWERGVPQEIYWTGGDHTDTVVIELYKDGILHSQLAAGLSGDERKFSWTPGAELVPSGFYMVRVIRNGSLSADSGLFTITGDPLEVSPEESYLTEGSAGGPFSPVQKTYQVTNGGTATVAWTATANQPWVNLAPASGNLDAGQSVNLVVAPGPGANALAAGLHQATVTIAVEGYEVQRQVQLLVYGTEPGLTVEQPAGSPLSHASSTITMTPATLGGSPTSRVVTLRNVMPGTTLNLTGVSVMGANASDFALDTTTMSAALSGSSSTTFTVNFAPVGTGVRTATLLITSNDPATPAFTVGLSGIGQPVTGPAQQIVVRQMPAPVLPVSAGPFSLGAFATSGRPVTYQVVAGGATVDGNGLVTPSGATGGVTVRVLQSGGEGYDPVESHVTFAVASWQPYTKVIASPLFNATFAIRNDGTLWSWGYSNGLGQLGDTRLAKVAATQVGTATNWTDVAVGNSHGLGLRADGTMWGWGSNLNGQVGDGTTTSRTAPVAIGTSRSWVSVAGGSSFSAAVAADGTLWTWGINSNGQLGHGDTIQRNNPTQVGTESNWAHVVCGSSFTIAVKTNGELWAWGINSSGQLGQGNTTQQLSPVRVGTANDWSNRMAASSAHVLALKTSGELWAWGSGASGQLGTGNPSNQTSPVRVGVATDWQSVSAGGGASAARKADGSLWIWGSNSSGQLGDGTTTNRSVPQRFATGTDWAGIQTSASHTVAWRPDGQLWIAGGGLGLSGVFPRSLGFAAASGTSWQQLSGLGQNFHAIRQDGTLWAWGRGASGQFGDGSFSDRHVLTQIGTETQWAGVSTGAHSFVGMSTLARKTNGTLWSAGSNSFGQLGDGTASTRTTFVQVGTATNWQQVSEGSSFSMGVRSDGTLWGWGFNLNGQLGVGDFTNRLSPTQVGTATNWRAISGGGTFSLGVRTDGSLWAWGSNSSGQLGDGTLSAKVVPTRIGTDSDWLEIAAGDSFALAIKTDGSLWAWGGNSFGQLGLGDLTTRTIPTRTGLGRTWSKIAACRNTAAAIAADGTLWTAGENHSGHTGRADLGNSSNFTRVGSASGWLHLAVGAQNLVAIQNDGSFWISGTTGPMVMAAGRRHTSILPGQIPLVPQTIAPVETSRLRGERLRIRGTSGLPADVRVVSGPATASAGEVSLTGAGTVVVRAWQAGDDRAWDAAPPGDVTLTVIDTLTHEFTSNGDTAFTSPGFTATGVNLNLALGYTPNLGDEVTIIENTSTSAVTGQFNGLAPGGYLYFSHSGELYGFRVNYAGGDGNDVVLTHEAAPQTFTVVPVGTKRPSDGPFSLSATSSSGLPVAYTVVTGPATVSGNLVTLTGGTGGVTIRATLPGNPRFLPGAEQLISFNVGDWPVFTKVAVSQSTWVNFAIHQNGTLWSWGYANGLGQLGDSISYRTLPAQIGTAEDWVDADVGGAFGLGMRAGGTLWTWGINTNGQLGDGTTVTKTSPVQIGAGKVWIHATVGNTHGGAVAEDGTLWTWGLNTNGQLGHGDTTQRNSPTQVGSDTDWSRVFCGGLFTVALKTNGELWAWGINTNGQLGIGSLIQQNSPVRIGTSADWADVAAGYTHVIALKSNGELWSWGSGSSGQTGLGTSFSNQLSPARIGTDSDWVALSASLSNSAAKKADGSVWIWGGNGFGQFGNGTIGNLVTTPLRFSTGSDWNSLVVGGECALGLKDDGSLIIAGSSSNFSGVLPRALSPGEETGRQWVDLSGTGVNFHLVRSDGSLWWWGRAGVGQVGDGSQFDRSVITRVGSESQWARVRTGGHLIFSGGSTIALKSNGTLWGTGPNSGGQLGDGTTTQRTSFVQSGTATNWTQFDEGSNFTMAVQSNGTLWGWGNNGAFQLGQGTTGNRSVPTQTGTATNWSQVACGGTHAAGIRTDGTLWAWGVNSFGQIGDGTFFTRSVPVQIGTSADWSKVVCGANHTMALKTDGTLWVWGNNSFGQLGRGNRIHSSVPIQMGQGRAWSVIAAGRNSSAAIATDGTLWTVGENHSGQIGDGTVADALVLTRIGTARGWTHVAMGSHSMAAIRSDGTVWTAGTTGPRLLAGGRDQRVAVRIYPTLNPQTVVSPSASYPIGAGGVSISTTAGLPARLQVVSGPATASGNTVSFTGLGVVEVLAWHPGDEHAWNAALPEQFTINVTKNPATITLSGLSRTYDGLPKAASVTTNPPGLLVSLTYNGDENAPVNAGSYAVSAVIDDPLYSGSATGTLEIGKAVQSITFAPVPDALATDEVALTATGGGSGTPVTFAVTNGPAVLGGGNLLTFTGAGEVTITASQAGNANYLAAPPVVRTFQVAKAPAGISLTGLSQTYNGSARPAGATTSPGGLNVVFTYDGLPAVPVAAGSYAVTGTIDDPRYQGAAGGTLVVAKAGQSIDFAAIPDQLATAEVILSASGGGSGQAIVFAVAGGPGLISGGNRLAFTGAGAVVVTATQAGDANHLAAAEVSQTVTVTKAPSTVNLSGLSRVYNGAPQIPGVETDPAGLSVVLTYEGLPDPPVNAGSYAVVATVNESRHAGSASGTLVVAKAPQAIDFPSIPDRLATDVVNLGATGGGSGNPVVFSVEGPAQLAANVLTFTGAGEVSVTANQAGDGNHEAATPVTRTFSVMKATASVVLSNLHQVSDGTPRQAIATTSPPGLNVTLTYNGDTAVPSAIGRHAVVATIDSPLHEGETTGELVVDDPARMVLLQGGELPAISSLGILTMPSYQMGAYEVTRGVWNLIRDWAVANGYDLSSTGEGCAGDHPVRGMNWYEAVKWCNARTEWENAVLGRSLEPAYRIGTNVFRTGSPAQPADVVCDLSTSGYRLPSAEEWEFAARGGIASASTPYPGGSDLNALAWFEANSSNPACDLVGGRGTWPVGAKSPNEAGLFDAAGNVSEWVGTGASGNPAQRWSLGGSWISPSGECALGVLTGSPAADGVPWIGLRLARSVAVALADGADLETHPWISGGSEPWFAQTGVTREGGDAIETGRIPENGESWTAVSVTGPGNLRFLWKTDLTGDGDLLRLSISGQQAALLVDESDWVPVEVEIPDGEVEIRWSLVRGSGETPVPSRAWVDQVSYSLAVEPGVRTGNVSELGTSSALLEGEVLSTGGRSVTERGIVWSTEAAPLEGEDEGLNGGSGVGAYSVSPSGLLQGTTYFFRAFAKNAIGIAYGEEKVFTTDTDVSLDGGVFGFDRTLRPGDRHGFRLEVDRPRLVSFGASGGSALRGRLTRPDGSLVALLNGNFASEQLLLQGDYRLELSLDPLGGSAPTDYQLDLDASKVALPAPDVAVGVTPGVLTGSGAIGAGSSQRLSLVSRALRPVTAVAVITNRGDLPDDMTVRGSAGSSLFRVDYSGDEGNISAAIVAGTYPTGLIGESSEPVNISVTVSPNRRKLQKRVGRRFLVLRKTYLTEIQATAGFDPNAKDAAQIEVRTR